MAVGSVAAGVPVVEAGQDSRTEETTDQPTSSVDDIRLGTTGILIVIFVVVAVRGVLLVNWKRRTGQNKERNE